jgi:hypothetical protein
MGGALQASQLIVPSSNACDGGQLGDARKAAIVILSLAAETMVLLGWFCFICNGAQCLA